MKNIELQELIKNFDCLKGLRINGALTGHIVEQKKEIELKLTNYQDARNEIILNFCEKNDKGEPVLTDGINPVFKDKQTELDCIQAITELDNAEFEINKTNVVGRNYLIGLTEISIEQYELLKLFIQ